MKYLGVISFSDNAVIKRFNITNKNDMEIDRLERRLNMNYNDDKYYTNIWEE